MASKFSSRAALPQCVPARILIVGGGPSGIAALRALLDDHAGAEALPWRRRDVALYERRADVGGVWCVQRSGTRREAG
jgi:cation diffusion facilitator CzcD-associated flavoprotein CzcO